MATGSTKLSKSTSAFQFQLPAIQLHSESLTDGTDIPPPPPSPPPKLVNPPDIAPPIKASTPKPPSSSAATPFPEPPSTFTSIEAKPSKQSNGKPLFSPLTKRPSSVRKFLSLRSNNRSTDALTLTPRPDSPAGSMASRPSLNRKRSSLLWGRRKSNLFSEFGERLPEEEEVENVRVTSPPPKLPELESFGVGEVKDEGGFLGGGEMFRDIK